MKKRRMKELRDFYKQYLCASLACRLVDSRLIRRVGRITKGVMS